MAVAGTPAVFFLSPEGERALSLWVGKRSSFPALMVSSDAVGAWITLPSGPSESPDSVEPVMLLKWDYVATMTFDYQPDAGPSRPSIGFRQM